MAKRSQFRCHEYVFEFTGDPQLVRDLEVVFVDLATSQVADPHVWEIETFEAHARLVVDRTSVGEWVLRQFLPANVISTLTMTMIAAHPMTLHLHAAAVVADGATVLLVAPSGSGKSTLACAFLAAGAEYRTDEVVAVNGDGQRIMTYPKPISVKAPGIAAVERLTGISCGQRDRAWHISASSLGALATGDDGPVTTIVLNRYVESEPIRMESVHRATAVRLILSDSQDAVVIGPGSLVVAANLTRSAHCLRVTGGDAVAMAQAILEAHQAPVRPGEVETVRAPTVTASPARDAAVHSVVIDGRALLYTPEPNRLIELDESQTAWWLLFDGTPFDDIVDEIAQVAGESRAEVAKAGRAFTDGFRSLGVLAQGRSRTAS